MNQGEQFREIVDGNNVMGPCAYGLRRERADPALPFVAEVTSLALGHGGVWTIVFDGQAPSEMASSPNCPAVVHTGHGRRNGADDRIVELVHVLPNRAMSVVYTSRGEDTNSGTPVRRGRRRDPGASKRDRHDAWNDRAKCHWPLHPADGAGHHHRLNGVLPTALTPRPRFASDCDEHRR